MVDDTSRVGTDDADIDAAIRAAQESFSQFLDAFKEPKPGQTSFQVRVAFIEGPHFERVWVGDLDFSGPELHGTITSQPALPSLENGQQVEFSYAQITDWMYVEEGRLVGGYTVRAIRDRLSEERRAEFDAASPFTF